MSRVPEATLHVYGGFAKWWATTVYKSDASFMAWRRKMEELLTLPGVVDHGWVGHEVIARAYSKHGFYLYPTDIPDTAPLNIAKAMAAGCIPITSRLLSSALPEFTREFDLGPTPREGNFAENAEWRLEWVSAVVGAPSRDLKVHRQRMKRWARRRFSWPRVAQEWAAIFR